MKNRLTTTIAAAAMAGLALLGSGSAVAMAAPFPAPSDAGQSVAHQDPQFVNGVHVTMINGTDRTLRFGDIEIAPGQRATISDRAFSGSDIVTWYGYDGGPSYRVEAKNPAFGYPWIAVGHSGERPLPEFRSFSLDLDGHRLDVHRDRDQDSGWKQFTIVVLS